MAETQKDIEFHPESESSLFLEALRDFARTIANIWMWGSLALTDIEFRYRRTILGPFWIMGATLALVLSMGFVYAGVFDQAIETYLPYLTVGIVYWTFLSGTATEGCVIFVATASLIKSTAVDISTHLLRHVLTCFIILLHNLVAVVLVWLWFRWPLSLETFLVFPGIFIGLLFTTGLTLGLAMVCTRYRDVQQIVISVMQLAFFITPIFWVTTALRPGHEVLKFNPFYYMLEVVRGPLLGQPVALQTWLIAAALGVASFVIGTSVYAAFRHRLTYWL
jgi:ABC-type polysaccharide/polyol phosphate export permease